MIGPRPFDLVIFDLDGTLADTLPDIAAALNTTLADAGFPPLPEGTIVKYVGDGSERLIERALPPQQDRRVIAALLAQFSVHYQRHPSVRSRLFPGIPTMLQGLTDAGVSAGVLTNKLGSVARLLLDKLLPEHPFARVIGDGDGFPRKPDPTAARALMAQAKAIPSRTVVVGDGLPDLRMGHALKAVSVAVAWGYVPREQLAAESPTWIADSPEQVLRLILG